MAVAALAIALTAPLSNLSRMMWNRGHTGQQCPAIWSNSSGAALGVADETPPCCSLEGLVTVPPLG